MDTDNQLWRDTLRQLPVPEPRERFADYALSWAASNAQPGSRRDGTRRGFFSRIVTRWETWLGAAVGAAAAAGLTGVLMRASVELATPPPAGITLALNEVRSIDVLVDSERELQGAVIRVAVSGGLSLEGFDDEREIRWNADLDRGRNVLTLPVIARSAGAGRIVAHIEHQGRTRQVTVDLTVLQSQVTPS